MISNERVKGSGDSPLSFETRASQPKRSKCVLRYTALALLGRLETGMLRLVLLPSALQALLNGVGLVLVGFLVFKTTVGR